MSDEYTVEHELVVQYCFTCGIVFAIPLKYLECRKEDGCNFYCPNSHQLAYPKIEDGEIPKEKISRLEEENTKLKNTNVRLMSQLDQTEAKLAEVLPPPSSPSPLETDEQ